MSFHKAKSWYKEKYKKPCAQRPWRKIHLSMDPDMNIHGIDITETDVADISIKDTFLFETDIINLEKVIADRSYYNIEEGEFLYNKSIMPVIPSSCHSVIHDKDTIR